MQDFKCPKGMPLAQNVKVVTPQYFSLFTIHFSLLSLFFVLNRFCDGCNHRQSNPFFFSLANSAKSQNTT